MRTSLLPRRRDDAFYDWDGDRPVVSFDGHTARGPITAHRVEWFATVHPASYRKVRDLLPTDDLRPVPWRDGRALMAVAGTRMMEISLWDGEGRVMVGPPYGETNIAIMVSDRSLPPGVDVIRGLTRSFIVHLPVTTRGAAEAGRTFYGEPKFVADMDFVETPTTRSVTVAEGGRLVLRLDTHPSGPVLRGPSWMHGYSSLGGQLLRTDVHLRGHLQTMFGSRSGRLQLGDHPVAGQLRDLEIQPAPLLALNYVDALLRFGAGVPVGHARPYTGYVADDEPELGRFTVAYPDAPPMDQYTVPREFEPLDGAVVRA